MYMRDDIKSNSEESIGIKKSKFGRPKKASQLKRGHVVKLSFTEDEFALIQKRAEAFGYRQVARYVHDYLLNSSRDEMEKTKNVPTVNLDAVTQLAGACNNFNQTARRLNSSKDGEDLLLDDVIKKVNEVGKLAAICLLSLQGRDDEVKTVLGFDVEQCFSFDTVEVVINGPAAINRQLANNINELLKAVEMRKSIQSISEAKIENELHQIKWIMYGVICYLQGMNQEGKAALEKATALSSGDQNGDS